MKRREDGRRVRAAEADQLTPKDGAPLLPTHANLGSPSSMAERKSLCRSLPIQREKPRKGRAWVHGPAASFETAVDPPGKVTHPRAHAQAHVGAGPHSVHARPSLPLRVHGRPRARRRFGLVGDSSPGKRCGHHDHDRGAFHHDTDGLDDNVYRRINDNEHGRSDDHEHGRFDDNDYGRINDNVYRRFNDNEHGRFDDNDRGDAHDHYDLPKHDYDRVAHHDDVEVDTDHHYHSYLDPDPPTSHHRHLSEPVGPDRGRCPHCSGPGRAGQYRRP
jgi:hypothetical protein